MNRPRSYEFVFQVIVAASLAFLLNTLPANANSKYAAMVVDGYSGKMVYGENVDAYRYPASITKVMTLYVVFEELRAGRLKKTDKFTVSKKASRQAPSKLGLKPGNKITVDHAIKALVTKSANDVAMVVAENISGSQAKFAKRMNKTAKALGMTRTTFRNPHGLPNKKQRTTARDLIRLSVGIERDFPKYYKYFSTQRFKYRGRTYRNHNKLLGRYKGTTGIKTGYTRASGYNLTAIVKRGKKKVVAVVLGGKSGRSRDAHMRKIISRAFPKVVAYKGKAPTLAPSPAQKPQINVASARTGTVAQRPRRITPAVGEATALRTAQTGLANGIIMMRLTALAPRNRELPLANTVSRSGRAQLASSLNWTNNLRLASNSNPAKTNVAPVAYASTEDTGVLSGLAALIANTTGAQTNAAAPAEPVQRKKQMARLILPPSSQIDGETAANARVNFAATQNRVRQQAKPAAAPVPPRVSPAIAEVKAELKPALELPDGYQIQVGAYAEKSQAEGRIHEVRKKASRLLAKTMGIALPVEKGDETFYRARFAGLAKGKANRTCKALKKRRIPCIVLSQ